MPHLSLAMVLFLAVFVIFVADAAVIHHFGLRMRWLVVVAALVAMMRAMILTHATGPISSASVMAVAQ